MSKHRAWYFRNQNEKRGIGRHNDELDNIRDQQQRQHQMAQNNASRRHRHPPKMQVVVLVENGASFGETVAMFSNSNIPKCKVFFRGEGRISLGLEANVNLWAPDAGKNLQTAINNQLASLLEDALLEFLAWLEKHSAKANENNPYFNLDEIREEFNYKKSRFGIWRKAAQVGFFNDMRPQSAEINKIVHLELQEAASNLQG